MRGRRPKPTNLKLLEGNPGKRPINTEEPQLPAPTDAFDTPPSEIADDKLAAAEWSRLAPMLRRSKTITDAERSVLLTLCQQWSIYLDAHSKIRTTGMVVKAPSGYPIVNPYLGIANKAFTNCAKLWTELGLTPSARSRITALENPSADPFAEFDRPPANGTHARAN